MSSMVNICITIDTEGDSANNPLSTFLGIEVVLPQLVRLFDKYDIKVSFLIQEDEICQTGTIFQNLWKSLLNKGHEIGYHAHGLTRASEEKKDKIITNGIQKLIRLGLNPVSFRAGRYHFDASLLNPLEKNNIKYDSSVAPGLKEFFNDGTVRCDHTGAPYKPYFPSYENHCLEGNSNILELPINRYPKLPSNRWGGILSGNNIHEEILFDYFHEIRKDKLIIIALHPWDGLASIISRFVRNKKYGKFRRMFFESGRKFLNPNILTNRGYIARFDALIQYILKKEDVQFVTIKKAGEGISR